MVTIVGLILGNVQVRVIKLLRLKGLPKWDMNLIIVQLHETIDLNGTHVIYWGTYKSEWKNYSDQFPKV